MPLHRRKWNVVEVATLDELAEKLTRNTWCLCAGFSLNGVLWLNDSSSENGAQEWAMVRARDGRQYESITIGWLEKKDDMANIVEYQMKYQFGTSKPMFGEGNNLIDGGLEHPSDCGLCA